MAAADRLSQLRRQRAQIADHLAWLDQEIQRESHLPRASTADELPPSLQPPPSAPHSSSAPAFPADPDAALEQWTDTTGASDPPLSKTGCWLIFATLCLLGIGGTAIIIYTFWG